MEIGYEDLLGVLTDLLLGTNVISSNEFLTVEKGLLRLRDSDSIVDREQRGDDPLLRNMVVPR